jgi:hypothetical protein
MVDWCGDGLDPMDQIALVEDAGRIQGWVGFDMLEPDKSVLECMEHISPDAMLTSDTSLVDAVATFCASSQPFFLVLQGNRFVGWLSYSDLHKPPLRLCLFALLLNIERLLLEVALLSPSESIGLLSKGRRRKAKDLYTTRGYRCDQEGEPYAATLLECTMIVDKLTIARKSRNVRDAVPALGKAAFCSDIEKLRNEIAHPAFRERSSYLLTREKLWRFVEWAETLERELEGFLSPG